MSNRPHRKAPSEHKYEITVFSIEAWKRQHYAYADTDKELDRKLLELAKFKGLILHKIIKSA